jgi:uncharacterized membrane protein YdjX (TVP38/TMEM64 family)
MSWILFSGNEISPQAILTFSPSQPFLAAVFLITMFILKSLSVLLPLVVLFIVGGILFPLPIAILINTLGVAVAVSVPYFIGRYSGAPLAHKLAAKYPRLKKLGEIPFKNRMFYSFFLRVINILPCDIVSIYLGTLRVPYLQYVIGCTFGYLPYIVSVTVMGSSINGPARRSLSYLWALQSPSPRSRLFYTG